MTFRITKAAELLQHTSLSVESIAISCGYQDPLVFTKAFRQMKGVSPSAYRKEMKMGETRKIKTFGAGGGIYQPDSVKRYSAVWAGCQPEVNILTVNGNNGS